MTFRVGQKVVFVGGPSHVKNWTNLISQLKVGQICTVRDVDHRYLEAYGFVGLRVEEEYFPPMEWAGGMTEPATLSYKFRPIVERKTDISIFTAMLKPQGVDA